MKFLLLVTFILMPPLRKRIATFELHSFHSDIKD